MKKKLRDSSFVEPESVSFANVSLRFDRVNNGKVTIKFLSIYLKQNEAKMEINKSNKKVKKKTLDDIQHYGLETRRCNKYL